MSEPLLIAIDFGATHTSVSFIYPGHHQGVCDIDFGQNSPRTASVIAFGPDGATTWGDGVDPDDLPLRWFKFSLLHHDDYPSEMLGLADIEQMTRRQRALQHTSIKVIGEYLEQVMKYALAGSNDRFDGIMGEDGRHQPRTDVVMAVPGTWRTYTHCRMEDAMRQHANMFGLENLGSLTFVPEQQTAALALIWLDQLAGAPQVHNKIVVCDCGGGTVDIAAYQIISTSPPAMRECAPAASRFTGAAVVDNSFRQLLLRKLRAALSHTGLVLNWSDPAIDTIMLRDWETEIKPKFSGDATVFYIKVRPADLGIPLPHPLSLEFTSAELREVFDSSVKPICELIRLQISSVVEETECHPEYVLLCGGFGTNKYLRSQVGAIGLEHTRLLPCPEDTAPIGIFVNQTANLPWVNSHICPFSFGILSPGHETSIKWIVRKDDAIPAYKPLRGRVRPPQFHKRLAPEGWVFWLEIHKSDLPKPPANNGQTAPFCCVEFLMGDRKENPSRESNIEIGITIVAGLVEFVVYRNGDLQPQGPGRGVRLVYQNQAGVDVDAA